MSELPTLDEVRYMRHGQHPGRLFRTARGTVVVNPAPTARAGVATAVLSPRFNAKQALIEVLLDRGWLAEDAAAQISTTDAGNAAIEAWKAVH